MTALSIVLPDALAQASQEAAAKIGISRTGFIRQAIEHELQHLERRFEQDAMIKSLVALRNSKKYLEESEEIDGGLNTLLSEESEQWWTK